MNTPIHPRLDHRDHADGSRAALFAPSSGYVPAVVELALSRWHELYDHALDLPHRTDAEHAVRADLG